MPTIEVTETTLALLQLLREHGLGFTEIKPEEPAPELGTKLYAAPVPAPLPALKLTPPPSAKVNGNGNAIGFHRHVTSKMHPRTLLKLSGKKPRTEGKCLLADLKVFRGILSANPPMTRTKLVELARMVAPMRSRIQMGSSVSDLVRRRVIVEAKP